MPYREQGLDQNYAAAGLIVNWPIFTGGYNQARQREAEFRAQAADEALMDLDAVIRRDVQLAYFNAGNALERASITSELRGQAEQAYSLANARYNAGSSSVIELSQAQLNLTTAEISETTTRYEYLLRRSILDFQSGALHASLRDAPPKAARTGK
jgi:outer membrane protein